MAKPCLQSSPDTCVLDSDQPCMQKVQDHTGQDPTPSSFGSTASTGSTGTLSSETFSSSPETDHLKPQSSKRYRSWGYDEETGLLLTPYESDSDGVLSPPPAFRQPWLYHDYQDEEDSMDIENSEGIDYPEDPDDNESHDLSDTDMDQDLAMGVDCLRAHLERSGDKGGYSKDNDNDPRVVQGHNRAVEAFGRNETMERETLLERRRKLDAELSQVWPVDSEYHKEIQAEYEDVKVSLQQRHQRSRVACGCSQADSTSGLQRNSTIGSISTASGSQDSQSPLLSSTSKSSSIKHPADTIPDALATPMALPDDDCSPRSVPRSVGSEDRAGAGIEVPSNMWKPRNPLRYRIQTPWNDKYSVMDSEMTDDADDEMNIESHRSSRKRGLDMNCCHFCRGVLESSGKKARVQHSTAAQRYRRKSKRDVAEKLKLRKRM